jgi:hypothetical protein
MMHLTCTNMQVEMLESALNEVGERDWLVQQWWWAQRPSWLRRSSSAVAPLRARGDHCHTGWTPAGGAHVTRADRAMLHARGVPPGWGLAQPAP